LPEGQDRDVDVAAVDVAVALVVPAEVAVVELVVLVDARGPAVNSVAFTA
jgi:hypothetical protein